MIDDQGSGHESIIAPQDHAPCRPLLEYDGDCGVCERLARWAAARLPGWEVVPGRGLTALRARGPDGRTRTGAAAANAVAAAIWPRSRALLAVLERCAPLAWIQAMGYRVVAANRGRISRLIGARACAGADRNVKHVQPGG